MRIRPGGVRAGIDVPQIYTQHLGAGLVATDGVVYTPVATFGTTALEVLNELIDPGYNMRLLETQVGLTQRFTELIGGTTNASLSYYWQAREEYTEPVGTAGPYLVTGGWVGISPTYTKGVASQANSDDTLSGYVPVASISRAPVRVRLMALGLVANSMTGRVKNSSFIQLVGLVIPGA